VGSQPPKNFTRIFILVWVGWALCAQELVTVGVARRNSVTVGVARRVVVVRGCVCAV
jgi:hypothetical protein